jgi:transcriptional regulator with XRE-family HTH domain
VLANLKATLAVRRLRQVDLSIELKISPSLLSEIINGRRSAEPLLRARLAEILQANEDWLFARTIQIPPKSNAEQTPTIA